MKLIPGHYYKSRCGECFGPIQASQDQYALPFFAIKMGQIFTFHAGGRYNNNGDNRHILDLVAEV